MNEERRVIVWMAPPALAKVSNCNYKTTTTDEKQRTMMAAGAKYDDERQRVLVTGLEVWSTIGVPAAEREQAQRLLIDLEVRSVSKFEDLSDEIERAVDYHALALRVKAVAEAGERRLIETLAIDIADVVLTDRKIERVKVRIRKFILADTEFVGVELVRRQRAGAGPANLDG